VILSEELELRGFLPLRSLYRNIPFANASLVSSSDARAKQKMCYKVAAFSRVIGDAQFQLLVYDKDSAQWYSAHDLEEAKVSHIKESSQPKSTAVDASSNMEDVDDEVILFKPGEGVKVEADPEHQQPAIGSGRNTIVDKSGHVEDMPANSLYAAPSFDLFGTGTGSGIFNGLPQPQVCLFWFILTIL
jgi:hypothetical protein